MIPPEVKEQQKLVPILDDMEWVKKLKKFEFADKVDLLKCLTLQKYEAGHRIERHSDNIDSYHLILKGKVGIFFPEPNLKNMPQSRIVTCNEAEAKKKRAKQVFVTQ